jgi:histidinol-phosphate/aromatic aminotransferase/cobyric acid decarboxylase-like protein
MSFDSRWVVALLIVAAVVAVVRVYQVVRRARERSRDDFDARLVQELRAAGANAFTPYEVDFFFSLPDETACSSISKALEPEGFVVNARVMGADTGGYSLNARKHLRVSVSEMQDYSKRFRLLAEQLGGQYDGWTTDPSRT